MTTVGVCLSGCGFLDGSEIHEAVLTLLHLDRAGVEVVCMAPDVEQREVVDHRSGQATGETRNVLTEAARIARGKIRELSTVDASELDALVLPGGFGAAKNLSDFAVAGAQARPLPAVAALVAAMHTAGKPIGAICISPAVVAACFQGSGTSPELTIGEDAGTAAALEAMGAQHSACSVTEFHVDQANRIVSTPAYMFDAKVADVSQGIERLVSSVLALAASTTSA